jgi:hypothetical protein
MSRKRQAGSDPEDEESDSPQGEPDLRTKISETIEMLQREQSPTKQQSNNEPIPAPEIGLDEVVYRPGCTEAFLNAQLLECVAIVRDAGWLYRNTVLHPEERGSFVNQAINLMEASAKVGEAIARLRGFEEPVPTTRQIFEVRYPDAPKPALPSRGEGGGRAFPENE